MNASSTLSRRSYRASGPAGGVIEGELLVGIRVDPHRFDDRLGKVAVLAGGRPVVGRQHQLRPALDRSEADVGRDRVQPRAQRAPALELRQAAPGAQQRFL
jgi:hypothetical protein